MPFFSEKDMTPIKYLKKHGIKHALYTAFIIKPFDFVKHALVRIYKHSGIRNIIVIESHNDFDCNGGVLYDYLLEHGYNKKYKIVWLLRYPKLAPKKLPKNVACVPFYSESIRKDYYLYHAKYITFDAVLPPKYKNNQTMFYLTHGGCTFKNTIGEINIPDYVDYVLTSSDNYAPYECKNFSIPYPNKKMLTFGFPYNDSLFVNNNHELEKITPQKYSKVILWMPTFRKGDWGKIDSSRVQPLGIPLIESEDELDKLNFFLKSNNSLLIIKIHPRQDMSEVHLESRSNIKVLTPLLAKELQVDNYRLMANCDALISDYSSAAYSFILLDRPIGFLLSDLDSYTRGFSVENYNDFLPGEHIYSIKQFTDFISDVIQEKDSHKNKRNELCNWLYEYQDGSACKRLVEFMNL